MGDTEPGVKAGRESDRQEDVIFKQFYNSWRTQTVVALQKSAPNHTDRKHRAQGHSNHTLSSGWRWDWNPGLWSCGSVLSHETPYGHLGQGQERHSLCPWWFPGNTCVGISNGGPIRVGLQVEVSSPAISCDLYLHFLLPEQLG